MEDRFLTKIWNKKKKRFEETLAIGFIKDPIKRDYIATDTEDGQINYFGDECKDLEIVNCTGLKDKNGKLIYEGDIVRSDEYPFNSDGNDNYYAEICFDNDTASFFYYTMRNPKLHNVRGCSTGNTGTLDEHLFEIIGNIYENKELLEEQE